MVVDFIGALESKRNENQLSAQCDTNRCLIEINTSYLQM